MPLVVLPCRIRLANRDTNKDDLDKLIAAHAASLNPAVLTNDEKDFARYPGGVMESWQPRAGVHRQQGSGLT
jgi:predicted nucleic acid-binding protein